jgi:two-component system response regulator FixJ
MRRFTATALREWVGSEMSPPIGAFLGWGAVPEHRVRSMTDATVYVVDDDPALRESLGYLLQSEGLTVHAFGGPREFLANYDRASRGCLVVDVRMPEMSRLQLQEYLAAEGSTLPIIVISGHGDVSMAVKALKNGALDFIEKPFADQQLLDRVREALDVERRLYSRRAKHQDIERRLSRLTKREREVMAGVAGGKANKVIAEELGLSPKTVEVHRARLMQKLEVRSLAQLMRLAILHERYGM